MARFEFNIARGRKKVKRKDYESASRKQRKQVKINKKDGYRKQNVRQRQKLISIIDYDVCMTFY